MASASAHQADQAAVMQLDQACFSLEFWQAMCPHLNISEDAGERAKLLSCDDEELHQVSQRIDQDGFATLRGHQQQWPVQLQHVGQGIEQLREAGWPPSFIMMFDEAWLLMHAVSHVMAKATGNAANMDMLAWRVDAAAGEAGFSPHRDRQPDDAPASFRADGTPRYATCWLALADATPDTGCLYAIPRSCDPGYKAGDSEAEAVPDPLRQALPDKEAFQHVRALPAAAGEAVLFSHRVIHWGSAGSRAAPHPRVSISFGFSDDTFEAPYIPRQHLPLPPLRLRLALVAAQMLVYHQRFQPAPAQLQLYKAAVDAAGADLGAAFRRKAITEFVAAVREAHERPAAAAGAAVSDDAVVDEAMEAMLDAELEGQNDFEDDFEGISDEVDSAGGTPTPASSAGAVAVPDGSGAAADAAVSAGPAAPPAGVVAPVDGGQGSIVRVAQSAMAVAAGSVVRSPALDAPGDSSTVMCADMHGDAAEEHASAAPGLFAVDGVMRWGKKRKR
eukprot:jgi/Ulvmu1/662/UM010_0033.1